jgi:hypothetical protein
MTTTANKVVESVTGTVLMSDGSRRTAYRNTYNRTVFNADGSFDTVTDVRIEFELLTNANARAGRQYRKTTPKQASTFAACTV